MLFLLPIVTSTYYQHPCLTAPFSNEQLFDGHFFSTSHFSYTHFFEIRLCTTFLVFSRYEMDALSAHAVAVIGNHGGWQRPSPLGAVEDIMIDDFL